jgi:hypothetical protein
VLVEASQDRKRAAARNENVGHSSHVVKAGQGILVGMQNNRGIRDQGVELVPILVSNLGVYMKELGF